MRTYLLVLLAFLPRSRAHTAVRSGVCVRVALSQMAGREVDFKCCHVRYSHINITLNIALTIASPLSRTVAVMFSPFRHR